MAKRGNNEGSVRKRSNGSWEGRYTAGIDPVTGRLISKSVYGKTRAECCAALKSAIKRASGGFYAASDKLTVADWLHTYLWTIKRPKVKPMTLDGYESDIRLYILPASISQMKILDVRRFHVQAFVDSLVADGRSAFVIRRVYCVLRNSFVEAERRGVIPINYAGNVTLPKRRAKPTVIMTQEKQDRFITALDGHRLRATFILAITTGMRQGELAALKWSDYADGCVSVTKDVVRVNLYDEKTKKIIGSQIIIQDSPKTTAGVRKIPLMPIAVEALRRHRMQQNDEKMKNRLLYVDNGFIFCNEIGGVYDGNYYLTSFYKILDSAGLPRVKFHALRHTFATRGLEAGLTSKELQGLLGHESPEMVMHYQHLLDQQSRAAIDRMAKMFNA